MKWNVNQTKIITNPSNIISSIYNICIQEMGHCIHIAFRWKNNYLCIQIIILVGTWILPLELLRWSCFACWAYMGWRRIYKMFIWHLQRSLCNVTKWQQWKSVPWWNALYIVSATYILARDLCMTGMRTHNINALYVLYTMIKRHRLPLKRPIQQSASCLKSAEIQVRYRLDKNP